MFGVILSLHCCSVVFGFTVFHLFIPSPVTCPQETASTSSTSRRLRASHPASFALARCFVWRDLASVAKSSQDNVMLFFFASLRGEEPVELKHLHGGATQDGESAVAPHARTLEVS